MRIALDCRSVFSGRGGIGRYAECLARGLAEIHRPDDLLLLTTDRQQQPIARGVPQVCIQTGMIDALFEQLFLPGLLLDHEVVLYHNPCFSLPVSRDSGKLVTTIHDVVFRERPELVPGSLRDYLDKWTEVAVRIADRIITVSHYSKERIARCYGADEAKIDVIYNGVEDRFKRAKKKDREGVCRKFHLPRDFLLYLGAIEAKKNIDRLLDAQRILRDARPSSAPLVLAGHCSHYDIESAIKQRGLEGAVVFLGYIEEQDVVALLSAATVFVYPSLYEGFGLPPLEAMACGTPVVVSNATSLPEVVGDAGVVVPHDDSEALATAIQLLLRNKDKRQELIQRGNSWLKQFSWQKCARQTLASYRKAVEGTL